MIPNHPRQTVVTQLSFSVHISRETELLEVYFSLRNLVYLSKLGIYSRVREGNDLSQNLALLTSSCPEVSPSQSASLSMDILDSSVLCQDRFLATRPQPSPI